MKSALRITAAAAAIFAGVGLIAPAFADGAADIETRKMAMKSIGAHSKALKDLVSGSGSKAELMKQAEELAAIGEKIHSIFPKGSDMAAGKTRAKDDIWSNPADFKMKADAFQKATADLLTAVKAGDMGQAQAAYGAVGKSCGGCHSTYRGPRT